ncbi:sigmaY antisigma factor component [Clostridium algoriphilum]|uniref:sigmaY antisigma factor component n=1 Tax=Clostridium algoriphilum TaxID=198347 RepID=UPI001CF5BC0B|nr:sigmaY antisigma factor component [Clostridium algoriphilum]MCB2294179.1 sigmaY antisigma factor component [Clostridium algoriphilum]
MVISNNQLIIILAIVIPILLIQGAWVFCDARRRREKYYWLWGIFALMNTPSNLLIYLLVTRVILKNKKKE